MKSLRPRSILLIALAAVVLGVATSTAIAATGPGGLRRVFAPARSAPCAAPALPGTIVDVTLTDMAAMMGPGMMGNMPESSAPSTGYTRPGEAMMRIFVDRSTVAAGPVSLRVHNSGALTHELLVLPLGPNQYPGQRAIGADGRVDESGSLAEASRTCGADAGDGITAGAMAWTTTSLAPGRYELECNVAGHYGAGMSTELDAVANR